MNSHRFAEIKRYYEAHSRSQPNTRTKSQRLLIVEQPLYKFHTQFVKPLLWSKQVRDEPVLEHAH